MQLMEQHRAQVGSRPWRPRRPPARGPRSSRVCSETTAAAVAKVTSLTRSSASTRSTSRSGTAGRSSRTSATVSSAMRSIVRRSARENACSTSRYSTSTRPLLAHAEPRMAAGNERQPADRECGSCSRGAPNTDGANHSVDSSHSRAPARKLRRVVGSWEDLVSRCAPAGRRGPMRGRFVSCRTSAPWDGADF